MLQLIMRKQHESPQYDSAGRKQCTQCKEFKPFSDFHKYSKAADGHKHFCRKCVREYDLLENDISRKFPRKYNKEGKIHCRNCGEYFEEHEMKQSKTGKYKGLSYCYNCASILIHTRVVEKYGITLEQYHEMLKNQNYSCKICGQKDTTFRKRLSIDHDHSCCPGSKSCGKCIRGLLCHHCNAGLGNFKDNPELLAKSIAYLK